VFNRTGSDGGILQFRKSGTTVGNIGPVSDDLYIHTGDTGLRFNDGNDQIWPVTSGGSSRDNAISLGGGTIRFKDLYLSGKITNDGTGGIQIDTSGKVGIGTTSPASRLDVKGAFRITRDVDAGHASEGNWLFNISHEDAARYGSLYLIPSVSTAEIDLASKVRIKNNGNVGIGTTNPYKKLEVTGDIQLDATDANIWIKSGAAGTNGFINWTFNTDGTVYNKVGMDYDTRATTGFHIDAGYPITIDASAAAGKAINFAISGATKAVLDGVGNVGIGTTSPQGKLHVNGGPTLLGVSNDWHQSTNSLVGTTLIRGGVLQTSISNDTTALKIYNAAVNTNKSPNNYGNGIGFMHLDPETYGGYTGQHAWIGLRIVDTPAQERSALVFATNNNTTSGSHPVERMTINPNGYVGIGNNTPGYHIDARGGSSTGDGMRVKTGDNGYDGLIVSSSAILKCYPAQGQSVSLQAYNSGGSTKTGVKVTGFDTPAGEISTKLEFVTEMLGHNVYDSNDYGTSNDQYVDLEDWTPNDFRILEIFGTANPNSGGSSAYADPIHMYVYNGSGWNGAEVTYYVYGKSVAPLARDMYNSGSGSSANVAEVWWYNSSTTAQQDAATHNSASGYHLRLKFPNTNTSSTQISLKVIKRA
jgi:hypothetical protein